MNDAKKDIFVVLGVGGRLIDSSKGHIIIIMIEENNLTDGYINHIPTSRRSRKDEEGRDFMCGCGKRYLSYPALYTHIKTKHNGLQPEGTLKTGTSITNKRTKSKLQEETLRQIYDYMDKEDMVLLGQLDQCQQGSVPVSSRIRREALPRELFECYQNLLKLQ